MDSLQYCAIIMRDKMKNTRCIFCIMHTHELVDIHARLCEVVCVLIDTIGTFPDINYVFLVQKDQAHLLGMLVHTNQGIVMRGCSNIPKHFTIDLSELGDLSCAVIVLTNASEKKLLKAYRNSFRCHENQTFLQSFPVGNRILGTIMPKYRNKSSLPYNLNDTKIVLALCYMESGTNEMLPYRPHSNTLAYMFDANCPNFNYMSMKLMPLGLTQSRLGTTYILDHVLYRNIYDYYHPDQYIMAPPVWINVCPYSISTRQYTGSMFDTKDKTEDDDEEEEYHQTQLYLQPSYHFIQMQSQILQQQQQQQQQQQLQQQMQFSCTPMQPIFYSN